MLGPQFHYKKRLSNEIWQQIALFLPRKDLKTLLLVPHPLSRIASQLIFRELDLRFSRLSRRELEDETQYEECRDSPGPLWQSTDAQRSADILTRIIVDPAFASVVRSLRIFSFKDGSMEFQTGQY